MSAMEYGIAHRYSPHNDLSLPNYYYNDRNAPLTFSHSVRADPRGYSHGDSLGSARGRIGTERNEPIIDNGASRRRITVACARCRKRKIRCSGDLGNGAGCNSCRSAGVEAGSCQFHRVKSDSVHNVMNNFQIAQSLTGMANSKRITPIYPTATSSSMYTRPMTSQTYPQLDTKPIYPSTWTVPYTGNTSPVETYGFEQSVMYLSDSMPIPMTNTNIYGSSCRWSHPTARRVQQAPNVYYDQDSTYRTHTLPYTQGGNVRVGGMSEPLSPLNMSSLRMTLPERPHPRQHRLTASVAPQRQLPFPQPANPVQSSRKNVLDELQGQALRSGQAASTSSVATSATFIKPPLPWSPETIAQSHVSAAKPISTCTQTLAATDDALDFLATAAIEGDMSTIDTAQPQLNFSPPPLFDPTTIPAPVTTYSTFRENRTYSQSSAVCGHNSHTNMYSFTPDSGSKRNSLVGESSSECKLVNGHRYAPLTHQPSQDSSTAETQQQASAVKRNVPLHRASTVNISGSV